MALNSVIGALRVSLGLDSAQFTTGLKSAEGQLGTFSKNAKLGLLALSAAAAAVSATLITATKHSIDHADAMSKMAQRAGVTTESLSRLAYAASFSDVSAEELTGSLGKLSKSMADASQNATGPAASAFAALGISVVDANGKLRDSSVVFSDIADRFSRIPDGATKTALSMALLGKSGAQLIPLLNGGANELKRFADESDRTHNTISTKLGRSAEQFNDTMATVGTTLAGVANAVAEALLPELQKFADAIVGMNPEILKWGGLLAGGAAALAPVVVGIGFATPAIAGMTAAVVKLNASLLALTGTLGAPVLLAGLAFFASTTPVGAGEDDLVKKLGLTKGVHGSAFSGGWGSSALTAAPAPANDITVHGGSTEPQMDLSLFTKGLDPAGAKIDTVTDKLATLKNGLAAIGPVAADAQQAMADGFDTAVGALGNLSGALSSAFKDSKQFAVATAILQGLQGVAYALGSSAPPWNFINAAAVGIQAAANVASILSTSEHSTSMPNSGSSSGSAAAAAQQGSAINLTVKGSGMISVDDIVSQLTQSIADGGNQALVKVIKAA